MRQFFLFVVFIMVYISSVAADEINCDTIRIPPSRTDIMVKMIENKNDTFDVKKASKYFFLYVKRYCGDRISLLPKRYRNPVSFFERTLRKNFIWNLKEGLPKRMGSTKKFVEWCNRGFPLHLPKIPVYLDRTTGRKVNIMLEQKKLKKITTKKLKTLQEKINVLEGKLEDLDFQLKIKDKEINTLLKRVKESEKKNYRIQRITEDKIRKIKEDIKEYFALEQQRITSIEKKMRNERMVYTALFCSLLLLQFLFFLKNNFSVKKNYSKKQKSNNHNKNKKDETTEEENFSNEENGEIVTEFDNNYIYNYNYQTLTHDILQDVIGKTGGRFLLPVANQIIEVIKDGDVVVLRGIKRSHQSSVDVRCGPKSIIKTINRAIADDRVVGIWEKV